MHFNIPKSKFMMNFVQTKQKELFCLFSSSSLRSTIITIVIIIVNNQGAINWKINVTDNYTDGFYILDTELRFTL